MKTIIKNWLDKPWTNRTYCKLTFWSVLASLVISLLAMKKIDRDFGVTVKKPRSKAKNTESLFDEVSGRDFRL